MAGSLIEDNLIEAINTKNEFGGQETAGLKIPNAVEVPVHGNVVHDVSDRALFVQILGQARTGAHPTPGPPAKLAAGETVIRIRAGHRTR